MKPQIKTPSLSRATARVLTALTLVCCLLPRTIAAPPQNPASKLYVADISGKSDLNTGEKIVELNNRSVFSAEGSTIETKADSTNSIVLSNGTGIFLPESTLVRIKRFVQEPFQPNRSDLEVEPSISHTEVLLSRGSIALCTSKLVAGSTMVYSTPLASVSIRGAKVVIQASDHQTTVSLIQGDITLRGEGFTYGQSLEPGHQAVITENPGGQPPTLKIQPIPKGSMKQLGQQATQACMARRTAYFDVVERKNEQNEDTIEFVAVEVTPTNPDDIGPIISRSAFPRTNTTP